MRLMSIWGWLLIGAASWALAIVLKIVADFLVQRSTNIALQDWAAAGLSGIWSSICEMGLCALAFWFWGAVFADALVTALGAALAELIVLLPAALSAHFAVAQSKAKDRANWSAFFIERSLVLANHLASRGLLWLGIAGPAGLPAVASAFGLFAASEGVQAYGQARDWDWLNKRTQWLFFAFLFAIICTEIALLIVWR